MKAFFLALIFLTGCATMVRGTTQQVAFDSDPPGAAVEFQGIKCVTPCAIEATRTPRPSMISFALDGRESYWGEIQTIEALDDDEVSAAMTGLIGALLILPGLYDLGSGTFYSWPKKLTATLPPKGTGGALLKIER